MIHEYIGKLRGEPRLLLAGRLPQLVVVEFHVEVAAVGELRVAAGQAACGGEGGRGRGRGGGRL